MGIIIPVIIILCLLLLIGIFLIRLVKSPSKPEYPSSKPEDPNFRSIQKLFFAVNPQKIPAAFLMDITNVYGLMIETKNNLNEDVIFAAFITGFAGYYTAQNGGLIAGKAYASNNNEVQQDLMEMCDSNGLTGKYQTRENRISAARLVKQANKSLYFTKQYEGSYSIGSGSSGFWFLTEEGYKSAEVKNSILADSPWKELVQKSLELIDELNTAAKGSNEILGMQENVGVSTDQKLI